MVERVIGSEPQQLNKVLHIALYFDKLDGIKAGLRMFPASKVILLYDTSSQAESAVQREKTISSFASQLEEVLAVNVEVIVVKSPLLEDVLDAIKSIYYAHKEEYREIILNLTEGNKILTCSALSSAFIFGLRAFWTDGQRPYVFPIIRLGYYRAVSEAKLAILNAVQRSGGYVNSLEDLTDMTGFDKGQLSHHINGSIDSKGLVELGLLEAERMERGRLAVKLTALGKILLTGLEKKG
ncbi:MAG: hypothetical protein QW767_00680 [Thermoprotei archaeon]